MSDRAWLAELAKRRGFFFPAAEAYGGVAGFYVYGPAGSSLKQHVEASWRDWFAVREGHMEVDTPTITPEAVFEASGHLENFNDLLVACAACGERHRADHLLEAAGVEDAEAMAPSDLTARIGEREVSCPACGAPLAGQPVEPFNLMFETSIGPGDGAPGYLRPETAQGIFVEFPRLAEYARGQLPFGVAQIGRAYRNEISPRHALLRVRELTQAELELFVDPERDEPDLTPVADVPLRLYPADAQGGDDPAYRDLTVAAAVDRGVVENPWIAYYLGRTREWYAHIGVDMARFRFRQHLGGERAHYAIDCWDAEAEIDGDWIELAGIATRGDYDLGKHDQYADEAFTVFREYDDPITVERPTVDPDMEVLGPAFGADAPAVAEALADLARRDPAAFDASTVTVVVDEQPREVDVEATGFTVETVTEQGEHVVPHVIEPSYGVERAVYTVLAHALREDEVDGEPRTVLALRPGVAPTLVGVFPLMDRDGLGDRARELATSLREAGLPVAYDDAGSIGRRYRRQDEIGTPFCLTVDYDTLEDDTVTIRDRDSAAQRRVPTDGLAALVVALRDGDREFESVGVAVADA